MFHQLRNLSSKLAAMPLLLLTLCVLTGWSFNASAAPAPDATTASGVVLDQDDEPLPGASVMVLGTTNGTSTDVDGKFSLSNVKSGASIRVSYVGCKPVTVKWEGTP
ncbi:MAG: hypothetical protein HFJ94_08805, partial [Muribaculaceae bacterium]|nr:hypothetical protein [Muribaculaceae bacterium]